MMSPQLCHGAGGSSSRRGDDFSSQIHSKHVPGADKSFLCAPETSQPDQGLSLESLQELPAKPKVLSQLTPTSHGAPLKCLG